MRHNHRLEGYAFALRPVELADAEFIVAVRTSAPERTRYLHPISPDVAAQRQWLEGYFARADDYYWVIERHEGAEREGLIGIYDLDRATASAEWGRWVLRPGSLAAVESALLIYRAGFETLGLQALHCLTVAENLPVLSFHDSCGLARLATLERRYTLGDGAHDAVKHGCTRAEWPALRARLEPQAQRIAQRLKRTA